MSDEVLFDDRLFLVSIFAEHIIKNAEGHIETKIHFDQEPPEPIWIVVYYRNQPYFPIFGTYHFANQDDALRYKAIVEPTTPLKSLGGTSPSCPMKYPDYVNWKKLNGFSDFSPDRVYTPGGENRREIIMQTQEQYNAGLRKVSETLKSDN